MAKLARRSAGLESQHNSQAENIMTKRANSGTLHKPKPPVQMPAQLDEALEIVLPEDVTVRQLAALLGGVLVVYLLLCLHCFSKMMTTL